MMPIYFSKKRRLIIIIPWRYLTYYDYCYISGDENMTNLTWMNAYYISNVFISTGQGDNKN